MNVVVAVLLIVVIVVIVMLLMMLVMWLQIAVILIDTAYFPRAARSTEDTNCTG